MKTLADYPELIKQWHPKKNGLQSPNSVRAGSKKKFWWICPKGHEHFSIVKNRTYNNTGCPYCSGNKVSDDNNLLVKKPDVAALWHPTKNDGLGPQDVTAKSDRSVWWICPKGHEHFSPIKTRSPNNCPYCLGKKAGADNNLQVMFPTIASQWHPIKNGTLMPTEVVAGSNKRVWWQCNAAPDHIWQASIDKRTLAGRGCPFCGPSPIRASSTNNLAKRFPEIAKYWHPTRNGGLTPEEVLGSSYKAYWWLCDKGHHFSQKVNKVTSKPWSCPYCSGKRIGQGNSLADRFPRIADEWDREKNGDITPDMVASKTNKKFWFTCPLNHSYRTSVSYRTHHASGCPNCTAKSSQQELRIYTEINWIFSDSIHRHKIQNIEFDVYIPSLDLAVEYDGSYWHRDSEDKDMRKNDFCAEKNIKLLRVREEPLPKLTECDVIVPIRDISKENLNEVINAIIRLLPESLYGNENLKRYLSSNKFLNDSHFDEYKTYIAVPHPSKSLAYTHPELCNFWDYAKNSPLKPEHFTAGSGRTVHWVCRRGHSFEQKITDRRTAKSCPICGSARSTRGIKSRTIQDERQMKLI